jgi:hypothetical protein
MPARDDDKTVAPQCSDFIEIGVFRLAGREFDFP